MTQMVSGKVTKISQYDTKFGVMYNVSVNGDSFGFGKVRPTFSEGDYVKFEWEQKGQYRNANARSAVVLDSPPEGAASAPSSGGYRRRDISDDPKQAVISKQAARNSAIAMFRELRELGAIPVSDKAKADVRMDAYLGIVDKMTEDYYNYSMGIESAAAAESEAEQGEPEDEPWDPS